MTARQPLELIPASATSDGAGVKLLRVFGGANPQRFDPFLMLDEFGSNEASDYIAGFPPHPHRGFETITYMLQGKMEHRDHMNNVGLLQDGDVQWMTAARGVIHSEMPQQTEGKMRGFQLWLNLPAKSKMQAAAYTDLPHAELPVYNLEEAKVIAIAGEAKINGRALKGYFQRPDTEPVVWDIHIQPGQSLSLELPQSHNVLAYCFEQGLEIAQTQVAPQHLLRTSKGDSLSVINNNQEIARLLLIAGKPLGEPIVQYGPFVMNASDEIEQAINDYRNGVLTD